MPGGEIWRLVQFRIFMTLALFLMSYYIDSDVFLADIVDIGDSCHFFLISDVFSLSLKNLMGARPGFF